MAAAVSELEAGNDDRTTATPPVRWHATCNRPMRPTSQSASQLSLSVDHKRSAHGSTNADHRRLACYWLGLLIRIRWQPLTMASSMAVQTLSSSDGPLLPATGTSRSTSQSTATEKMANAPRLLSQGWRHTPNSSLYRLIGQSIDVCVAAG